MSSAPFTATLGPNVTIVDASGSTLLTPITDLSLAVSGVSASTPASGSATVSDGTLAIELSVPAGATGTGITEAAITQPAVVAGTNSDATLKLTYSDGTSAEVPVTIPAGAPGDEGKPGSITPATRAALGGVIIGGGFGLGSDGTIVTNTSVAALSGTALTFSTDGSRTAVTLTPTAATTLTLTGGKAGVLHELVLVVKQGETPFAVTLPSNVTTVGTVAVADTAYAVTMVRFTTVDGGTTYIMSAY